MIDKIQLSQLTSNVPLGNTSNCDCKNSNSNAFEMVMISLLKAVVQTNINNNVNTDFLDIYNNNSNSNLETENTIINTNKIQSTNKDQSINERIDKAVAQSAKKYGVDENLIKSIIKVESNFNPNCVSKSGAMGLMQLMPENVKHYGVSDPFNIEQNIDGGARHIKDYLDKYNGNVEMALMAYNGGPTRMANRGVKSMDDIYKMPKETQNYVPKVMKHYMA
ncbi:lytic transglycosylase domain-containing protein [Romboutsia sp.]|uniref:lytic transglycosylase domain-containing protein n=1 Tax=Romboutsia sp. TaxID=1965302 RepID=UPI003F35C1BC